MTQNIARPRGSVPGPGHRTTVILGGCGLLLLGCYQGEWRIGPAVAVGSQKRVLPTRDVERWELDQTVTPFVVRVRGDLTQRCRGARFGTTRRTDTGRFRRTGGNIWTGVAIGTGAAGGALTLAGGAGWIARDSSAAGKPAMYTVGGAFAAGGIVSCALAIQQPSRARGVLCGTLLGAGLSIVGGTLLNQFVWSGQPEPGTVDPLRSMVFGGGALLGVSLATGIVGALWRGDTERTRVIEESNGSLWDQQETEAVCGPARPMIGRSGTLEVSAERAAEGPGSEAEPLRVPVVLGDEGTAAIDLRPLRQTLAECGVLRVRLTPDTLYDQFVDDLERLSYCYGTGFWQRLLRPLLAEIEAAGVRR